MPIFNEQPPVDWRELVTHLVDQVSRKVKRDSDTVEWTKAVKSALYKIGKDKKLEISPDSETGEGEFMLDLVWWRDAKMNDLALAAESEWGNEKCVWHDFGKLLVTKAQLKLMIYGYSNETQGASIRGGIEEHYMRKFTQHVANEVYVLAEFVAPENSFQAYACRIKDDGQLRDVVWDKLKLQIWSSGAATPAAVA